MWLFGFEREAKICHHSTAIPRWFKNKKIYKVQITHICHIMIGYCGFNGTHFRILKEWYEYLKNIDECFK